MSVLNRKARAGRIDNRNARSEPPVTAHSNRNCANRFPPSAIAMYRDTASTTGAIVCLLAMASAHAAAVIQTEAVVIRLRPLAKVQAIVAKASAAASVWMLNAAL